MENLTHSFKETKLVLQLIQELQNCDDIKLWWLGVAKEEKGNICNLYFVLRTPFLQNTAVQLFLKIVESLQCIFKDQHTSI